MSVLLEFLGISTVKDWKEWCRKNAPDKSDHPDATARFQLVTGEFRRCQSNAELSAELARIPDTQCTAMATEQDRCKLQRLPNSDSTVCFYHDRPENLRFVPLTKPAHFFLHAYLSTEAWRSYDTCIAQTECGKYSMSEGTVVFTEEPKPKPNGDDDAVEQPCFDIRDESWNVGRPGMLNQRVKHRLVLVRHGESVTNAVLMARGKSERNANPPLTLKGRQQAHDIANYLKHFGDEYTAIETSPLTRAHQTAWPTMCWAGISHVSMYKDLTELWPHETSELTTPSLPTVDGALALPTWEREKETFEDFNARIGWLLERYQETGTPDDRAHSLVFTHSLVIDRLLNAHNPTTTTHLSNGSITVIDLVEGGGMHVHLVNHTAHLRHPTGHHTAFTACPVQDRAV